MTSLGLTIPQRGALFGVGELPDLLGLAVVAEESGYFDTVWIGDSLTSKHRAESLSCLAALAGMTRQVRLATGCMASFPVRDPALFAYQWATLDEISGGRALLVVCNGLQKRDGASEREGAHFGGVPDRERVPRLEEHMDLVRELWTGSPVTFHGKFSHYDDLVILPTPRQHPCPIWISANPVGPSAARVLTRVATKADGFLTIRLRPGYIRETVARLGSELEAAGRRAEGFPVGVYHSINVGPDRERCLDESLRFFDEYYGPGMFDRESAPSVTALGPPEACVEQLRAVLAEGTTHLTLRVAAWDQRRQLDTVIEEVLPALVA